jgi:hypothetical protein
LSIFVLDKGRGGRLGVPPSIFDERVEVNYLCRIALLFRTLVRNSYDFHLNEIFATVQNEYSDWFGDVGTIRPRRLLSLASHALQDKLYLAPAVEAAEWCEASGFNVYFYVFGRDDDDDDGEGGGREIKKGGLEVRKDGGFIKSIYKVG